MLKRSLDTEVLAGDLGFVEFGVDRIHLAPSPGAAGENLTYDSVASVELDTSGHR